MAITKGRRIVVSDQLWEAFEEAVRTADPEANRSQVVRSFVRWYVGEKGARLPERPDPKRRT